jgi:hypothetical protein
VRPTALEARELSVSVDRSAAEVYERLSPPGSFQKWSSWIAAAAGPATLRVTERNSRGVLDYAVGLPGGASLYVPLRIVSRGEGCELVLTLFRQPEMSDERFAEQAEWMTRDLRAAKRLVEGARVVPLPANLPGAPDGRQRRKARSP